MSLAHRFNPELTDKLLKQGATPEQILQSIEAVMSCAPTPQQQQVPVQQLYPQESPFSLSEPGGPMASVSGFGQGFDREYEQGRLVAQSLKDRGYGPSHAGMRNIA